MVSAGFRDALLKDGPIDVITVDTFALLRVARGRVEVSKTNSGSSPRTPLPKGIGTWQSLDAYSESLAGIKEIAVLDRVDEVETMAISVVRVFPDRHEERVWP